MPQESNAPTHAEHHLGDRLAALVDGELGHDQRDRVLAHLATCGNCRSEADAQRRLKNVFADAAPPPPSDGLLARLQQLPGEGHGGHFGPDGGPPGGEPRASGGQFGGSAASAWDFGQLPGGRGRSLLAPGRGGFRFHETERSGTRGRRFAVAAAGAVSLAALTLGGAFGSGGSSGGGAVAGGDPGKGPSVGQSRPAANGSAGTGGTDRDGRRRSSGGTTADTPAVARSAERSPETVLAAAGGGGALSQGAGALARAARDSVASGSGPLVSPLRNAHPFPLLRDTVLAPSLTGSALPPVTYTAEHGLPGAGAPRGQVARALPTAAGGPAAR